MTQRLTTKPDLQNSLFVWTNSLQQIQSIRKAQETIDFRAVQREMDKFVRSFVPLDIDEEDIAHYCNSLISDEVFFLLFKCNLLFFNILLFQFSGIFRCSRSRTWPMCQWRICGQYRRIFRTCYVYTITSSWHM